MHGIGNGIGFLHTMGVIHNGLTADNIILNNIGGGTYLPVIGGFSKACWANAADLYMCENDTKFPVHHLPIDIQLGKRLPDFRSDLYSMGVLLRCFFQHCKEDFISKYCHLSSMCIHEEMYTSEFLEHIMDLCSGCSAFIYLYNLRAVVNKMNKHVIAVLLLYDDIMTTVKKTLFKVFQFVFQVLFMRK